MQLHLLSDSGHFNLKYIFSIIKIFQISTFKIYQPPHSLFFPYSAPAFLGFTTYIFIFLHLHACQYDPRRGSNETNMVGFQYQIFLPLNQPRNPNPLHHWQHCHHLIRHCHDSWMGFTWPIPPRILLDSLLCSIFDCTPHPCMDYMHHLCHFLHQWSKSAYITNIWSLKEAITDWGPGASPGIARSASWGGKWNWWLWSESGLMLDQKASKFAINFSGKKWYRS